MKIQGFVRGAMSVKDMEAIQYYRCYLPLREVDRSADGIAAAVVSSRDLEKFTAGDAMGLCGCDIYVMARMYHADCEGFTAEIHRQGGILVLDSDDDLTEDYKLVSGRGREFKRVLGMVDYVTVSTPALGRHFRQYTKKAPVVLRNCVDAAWMKRVANSARRLVDGLTIGFSGSPTHWGDWRKPSVPLARIARDLDVVPILHGEVPRYLTYTSANAIHLGGVPYATYPILLKQIDIVLCAVDSQDRFNAGKSAVKALETMAIGNVAICSRFEPYMELKEQGAPVVIVEEDSQDGWYEAMRDVIQGTARRKAMSEYGPEWVRDNRDMVVSGYERWERFYRAITD